MMGGVDGVASPPVIQFSGVGLTYPGPPPVAALRPCDLTIGRGELVSIVGRSGSGKSTMLNVLGLLDRPSEGVYRLDGVDTGILGEAERTSLRGSAIGFVFQAYHLLPHRTARENVEIALMYNGVDRASRAPLADEALARMGMSHRRLALPSRLSGGEKQRVAVARALAVRPSLLLCDEPTGNLDTANAEAVLELIESVNREGMTVVIVTHDPGVARRAGRMITLLDGHASERPVPGGAPR